jgi:hypothetical protein
MSKPDRKSSSQSTLRTKVVRVTADGLGRLLIAPHPERVTASEAEQFGVLPQQRRDFDVGRRHRFIVPLGTGARGKGPGCRSSARRRFRHRGDRRQQVARRRRRGSIRRMARFWRSGRVAQHDVPGTIGTGELDSLAGRPFSFHGPGAARPLCVISFSFRSSHRGSSRGLNAVLAFTLGPLASARQHADTGQRNAVIRRCPRWSKHTSRCVQGSIPIGG